MDDHPGQILPLHSIEPRIVKVLIQMSLIGESLTPSKDITLINDLIEGTSHQKKLVDWKMVHTKVTESKQQLGQIGYGYYQKFKRRNKHKITTSRQKI